MGYVTNQIKTKLLLRHPLRVFLAGFLHIHTLLLTTFSKNKKRVKIKKNVKNVKKTLA